MQLQMVPMIDVVFLLLVFFLLTANFRSREGFLPAELPRQVVHSVRTEIEPLGIQLCSRADGSCQIQIADQPVLVITPGSDERDFDQLTGRLKAILELQGRHLDDPIKLMPDRQTKWDHVVKTYNALWQLNLCNIIFAMTE